MKEKIKSYILILLIMASVIQVGILWSYQNYGIPTIFISSIFNRKQPEPSAQKLINAFFLPLRIIASDGNESHWIIGKSDVSYESLWDQAKVHFQHILDSKKPIAVSSEEWGALVSRRGFVFEFKIDIPADLFKWFLEKQASSQDMPPRINKIMIEPRDYDMNIYLLERDTREDKVWKYTMENYSPSGKSSIYTKALSKMERDENSGNLAYKTIRELYGDILKDVSDDILSVTKGLDAKYRNYKFIDYAIPSLVSDSHAVANMLFTGNEQDSYTNYEGTNGTKVFNNADHVYRVYHNGLLEYRYLPGYSGSEKVAASSVFELAARFIEKARGSLSSGSELYLSGIIEKPGYCILTFDYLADGIPVYLKSGVYGDDGQLVKNAVMVKANNRRILELRWILRNISTNSGTGSFNLKIDNILDDSGLRIDQIPIRDMGVSYMMDDEATKKVNPVWIIEMADGAKQVVNLRKQGE